MSTEGNRAVGPPAYIVGIGAKRVRFRAPDKSWRLTMSRDKWRECGRPEAIYAVTAGL